MVPRALVALLRVPCAVGYGPEDQVRLSLEAVGLMLVIACQPQGVDLSAGWIEAQCGVGKDKRQRIMLELRRVGLVQIQVEHGSDGRWSKTYLFNWDALLVAARRLEPGNPAVVPEPGNPAVVQSRKTRLSRKPENPAISLTEEPDGAAAAIRGEAAAPSGVGTASLLGDKSPVVGVSAVPARAFSLDRARVSASAGLPWLDPQGEFRKAAEWPAFEAAQAAENRAGQGHGVR